ncbi:Long-chain-fatty-acid--CoA ligase 5 [Toxocara canis]|uniref:Long-chain-fatty-acid--CoA ligase n=1 Tax=Toxocara canis TaxID=6265 RepID=A0A0B2VF22_TOXCA|nr:Long-chain-fatty-acid--CoA ligase 5 [Toxocara canis]
MHRRHPTFMSSMGRDGAHGDASVPATQTPILSRLCGSKRTPNETRGASARYVSAGADRMRDVDRPLKVKPIVKLSSQSRLLPDGSRIAACLHSDQLLCYNFEDARTIHEAVRRGLRQSNNGPMLGYRIRKADGSEPYAWLTYGEVIDQSIDLAYGLIKLGIAPGQETFIGIYAKNRPEWVISELAAYNNSNVVVSIYATLGPDARNFILNQANIEVVVCDDEQKVNELIDDKSKCASLKHIIMIEALNEHLKEKAADMGIFVYQFSEVQQMGRHLEPKPQLLVPKPEDLCTICYTSGTTGQPKGAMLTHGNIIACTIAFAFFKNSALCSKDVMISYLPLAHMYERVMECNQFGIGGSVGFFSGDIRRLADDMKQLKPTVVPLVISEVEKSLLKKTVFHAAVAFKNRDVRRGIVRSDSFFDRTIFKRIREQMGGRVRVITVGSAPTAKEVLSFARAALGCIVVEGYGQTECSAAASAQMEGDPSVGHVGIPLMCNAIKLVDVPELEYYAQDNVGEICVRGYNVFKGYYKNEEATKEALDADGWLHTGDIGQWNANGTLSGEYIAPERIENVYVQSKLIAQLFVHGESLKSCLVAIVVPNEEVLRKVVVDTLDLRDATFEELCSNIVVKKMILDDMFEIGKKAGLFSFEQVKDIFVSSEQFTVENDLLTPTLKGKRPNIKKHFATQLAEMYSKLK